MQCLTKQQRSRLTEVITSPPQRKTFRGDENDDGQPVYCPMRKQKRKRNSKPPTRRANSFRVKSAKPICGRLWKRRSQTRSSGKNTWRDKEQRKEYVERNNERKKTNAIRRKVRLSKKVNLQKEWSYFCTFTFSDEKHTEESFRKSLRNTLKHLVNRKGWKHIGVWERGGENGRLHFHGIFYIPPDGMVGEIVETKDYNTKDHRMQTAHQNTYFLERYGRNDFQPLGSPEEVQRSLGYLMKYIEKSGERLIYGGKLPTYFESDVMDEDILAPYGIDDRKAILADDFTCMVDGEVIGTVSPEVIAKMPKVN